MQRIGIVDVGSNTARLIIMEFQPFHSFRLVDEVSERLRLIEGIDRYGMLQEKPMQRAIETITMFTELCRAMGIETVIGVATSAVRDARNQAAFLERVEQASGLRLRVLSGEEEAYYGCIGVANSLYINDAVVVDIGGGSAEVSQLKDRLAVRSVSIPAGIVRFSERYVRSDPISNQHFRALEAGAREAFETLDWLPNSAETLVAVGGTARSLARMHQKLVNYPIDHVHAYSLKPRDLERLIEMLRGLNQREREHVPGLNANRADVILAGAVLFQQLMKIGGFREMLVSGQGLREGIFYEHFLKQQQPPLLADVQALNIENLFHRYVFDEVHAKKVRDLSQQLFDQLVPLHGYGAWERKLLTYSALLHDIGIAIDYYDHHKHSAYLVLNSALGGFSHREIVLMMLLTRYHRKGDVSLEPFTPVLEEDDKLRVERLSSLLRLAENLERSKTQVVEAIEVKIKANKVNALVRAKRDATVEVWNTNRRSGLFKKAFGRAIEFSLVS